MTRFNYCLTSWFCSYERARAEIDVIFGQRFHPEFPWQLRSCDPATGCGTYPSTSGGLYRGGIDLRVGAGSQVGVYVTMMSYV